ncbi:MAG: HD domain-containing protein, partial [Tissierellaceae bacterium]
MKNSFYDFIKLETEKDYLLGYKNDLQDYVEEGKFREQLSYFLKGRSFSVFSLLELYYDLFKKYKNQSPQDWLVDIFNWANNKSFPHKGVEEFNPSLSPLYKYYLENLKQLLCQGELIEDNNFIKSYPISFLTSEEELDKNMDKEYFVFKDVFYDVYINELMHLDMAITGHNTLDHVIGVNYLSMYIARQLYQLKLPVDLGLVAGASLGHDIGKYGVLEEEKHRVPYLHYYYTEEWFKRFGMARIGHIATNHSTWDLELETLPIESLILIYADFRVKNRLVNGNYNMHIYSLEESFNVILEKLDNVDEAKENRYKKVYKRLKDFEDYMISMGVDTSLEGQLEKLPKKPYELMNKKEVIESLKHISIEYNINLMSKLTDNISFTSILETTRGEINWRRLRFSLQIFDEYSTYLTQNQKIKTLYLLYDLLYHSGEDIRKEAAELIGKLIALFDEEYRKELPESVRESTREISSCNLLDDFLNFLLFPDHKIADSQREWLYNLKNTIRSLFRNSYRDYIPKYFDVLSKYYDIYRELPTIAQFYLSQTIDYLPIEDLDKDRLLKLFTYTLNQLDSPNLEVRLTTLDSISHMLDKIDDVIFIASIRNWLITHLDNSSDPSENYIKYIIGKKINISPNYFSVLVKNYVEGDTSEIFLQNLKTATPWVNKKINIDILYDQVIENPASKGLHTSMHLCNILKVSAVERVRNYGGVTLLNIFHLLSPEERNDVAVELLRALEMESYQFTKFIPDYLGQLLLYLPPKELDEIIDDFKDKIKVSSTRVTFLLLNTIAVSVEKYMTYRKNFPEDPRVNDERINRLLGLLAIGMASYNHDIKSESLRLISLILFKSNSLSLKEKYYIFSKIEKKILTLLDQNNLDEFLFYNNVSSLNNIYKFISDYEFYYGDFKPHRDGKIAFFPGTFDPFSLSHKEIAVEIRDMGFEVYLAVDEFSWSKRTEPHNFRRNIINMSIADEKDINLFPKNIPINIGNDGDLSYLRSLFSDEEVYIVVGSDVIINASAYKGQGAILALPHIIFERKS